MLDNLAEAEIALIEKWKVRFAKRDNYHRLSLGLEEMYSILAIARKLSRDCGQRGFVSDVLRFCIAYTTSHVTGTVCPRCGRGLVYIRPGIYQCDSCSGGE